MTLALFFFNWAARSNAITAATARSILRAEPRVSFESREPRASVLRTALPTWREEQGRVLAAALSPSHPRRPVGQVLERRELLSDAGSHEPGRDRTRRIGHGTRLGLGCGRGVDFCVTFVSRQP
jgi:hypothetical protein